MWFWHATHLQKNDVRKTGFALKQLLVLRGRQMSLLREGKTNISTSLITVGSNLGSSGLPEKKKKKKRYSRKEETEEMEEKAKTEQEE